MVIDVGPQLPESVLIDRPQANLVFEWGSEYLNRGMAVVPLPFRSKAPIINDWQNLAISAADADQYFDGRPANIGVRLGERSGWLVDMKPVNQLSG